MQTGRPAFYRRVRWSGRTAVVELVGELDIAGAHSLRTPLLELTRMDCVRTLAIDLRELRFIDSNGLAVIVEARERMMVRAGRVVLWNPLPGVAHVLQVAGLDQVFEIEADPALA